MAASNTPITMLGITDPCRWSVADWAADLIPHLAAYGTVAAVTYHGLCDSGPGPGRRR